jgi:hypothetical protein
VYIESQLTNTGRRKNITTSYLLLSLGLDIEDLRSHGGRSGHSNSRAFFVHLLSCRSVTH